MLMAYLESTFEKFLTVVGWSSTALSRSFINLILFSCVLEERILINKSKKKAPAPASSSFTIPVTPPKMIAESPNPTSREDLCVYFQTEIRQTIKFHGTDYVLSGIADYSLGYNHAGTGSGNLIVVEAKRRHHIARAVASVHELLQG